MRLEQHREGRYEHLHRNALVFRQIKSGSRGGGKESCKGRPKPVELPMASHEDLVNTQRMFQIWEKRLPCRWTAKIAASPAEGNGVVRPRRPPLHGDLSHALGEENWDKSFTALVDKPSALAPRTWLVSPPRGRSERWTALLSP